MKFPIPQVRRSVQGARNSTMRLTFAALLGTLAISAAHAQQYGEQDRAAHNHRQDASDNYQHDRTRYDDQGERNADNRHGTEYRRQNGRYAQQYRHPYSYSRPVYAPPPVYYRSQQSPGIRLFFPLDVRN